MITRSKQAVCAVIRTESPLLRRNHRNSGRVLVSYRAVLHGRAFRPDNWLSNRVFTRYDDIVDHCAYAWNKLAAEPWRIMTLGLRDWAHGF